HRLVFVNGLFAAELSSVPSPNGAVISSLAGALKSHTGIVEKYLGRYATDNENSFAALNTAFFQDGGFVYVPAGKVIEKPIHLLYLSTAKDNGTTSHPRNLIVAEKGSHVTVLETYASTAEASYLTNAVTELIAGEDAVVEHCKFQDESAAAFHIAAIHAHMG